MSVWGAFGIAAAFLLAPWVLMPRRDGGETGGLVGPLWWLNALYCAFWHRLEVRGRPPIPETGPAILICNHTCCIDHVILQAATRRLLGFMIARELYEYWLFRPFVARAGCIPVNRDGRDLSATRAALRALEAGRVLPVFPEGKITPASGRALGEGKPGVAFIALRAGVPVIPAYIWGTPETNKVARSFLTPSHAHVTFGPPVGLSDLTASGHAAHADIGEVTGRLMGAIRALRDEIQGPPRSAEAVAAGPAGESPTGPTDAERTGGRRRAVPAGRAAS
jgi:1-acyl-sn-glycerol-3-phosphate acyltransferase